MDYYNGIMVNAWSMADGEARARRAADGPICQGLPLDFLRHHPARIAIDHHLSPCHVIDSCSAHS
eukprot:scaffold843_cov143-Skeletonema_menzelii.AAC.26